MKTILSITILIFIFLLSSSSFAQPENMERLGSNQSSIDFETWLLIPTVVLTPLVLSNTQSDMKYGEALGVTTAGSFAFIASFALGALVTIPAWYNQSEIVLAAGALALTFGASLVAGFAMQEVDQALGAKVEGTWIPPLKVAGGIMAGMTVTWLVLKGTGLEFDIRKPHFPIFLLSLMLSSTVTYALSREQREPMMMGFPAIQF